MAQGCSYLSESYVAGSRSWEGNPPVPPAPPPTTTMWILHIIP